MSNRDDRKTRRAEVPALIKGGAIISLALSLGIFVLYLAGSFQENSFIINDIRFLLLRILLYLSLFLTLCSLCALGFAVRLMVLLPRLRSLLGILFYMFTGILGSVLVILSFFIAVASGGNG